MWSALRLGDRGTLYLAAAIVLVACGILACVPTRIDVGFDGVGLKWLVFRRFIRYADVRSVAYETDYAWMAARDRNRSFFGLQLATGKWQRLPMPGGRGEQLADRIRQAKQTYDAGAMHGARAPR
jgi:hypothetical protein